MYRIFNVDVVTFLVKNFRRKAETKTIKFDLKDSFWLYMKSLTRLIITISVRIDFFEKSYKINYRSFSKDWLHCAL